MPVIKPARREKYNKKTVQIHNNKTLNKTKTIRQEKKYKLSTRAKTLNPEKNIDKLI